jgi:heme/copper-type cytochrome/quinol oxidase subunit 1
MPAPMLIGDRTGGRDFLLEHTALRKECDYGCYRLNRNAFPSSHVRRTTHAVQRSLEQIWEGKPGIGGWLSTVDHKEIGKRYIVTAFIFLIIGGLEALLMRVQLARPNQTLLTPEQYSQTIHHARRHDDFPVRAAGALRIQQLSVATAAGLARHGFPAIERAVLLGVSVRGIFLYSSFPFGKGPDAGWFNYVPYASLAYNPGPNIDVYALGMVLLGISTTVGSINFIVTLARTRAPGMSINRVPILVWGTLTASVGNLFAVPAVSLAFFMLWMDRQVGTHFFDSTAGGQPLLWQHLFWMFGHPWVYAIVLPAMGIVSDALPTFCRRPLVGYTPSRSPPSRRWCWASVSGCTTCSPADCRSCRSRFSARRALSS